MHTLYNLNLNNKYDFKKKEGIKNEDDLKKEDDLQNKGIFKIEHNLKN